MSKCLEHRRDLVRSFAPPTNCFLDIGISDMVEKAVVGGGGGCRFHFRACLPKAVRITESLEQRQAYGFFDKQGRI